MTMSSEVSTNAEAAQYSIRDFLLYRPVVITAAFIGYVAAGLLGGASQARLLLRE